MCAVTADHAAHKQQQPKHTHTMRPWPPFAGHSQHPTSRACTNLIAPQRINFHLDILCHMRANCVIKSNKRRLSLRAHRTSAHTQVMISRAQRFCRIDCNGDRVINQTKNTQQKNTRLIGVFAHRAHTFAFIQMIVKLKYIYLDR